MTPKRAAVRGKRQGDGVERQPMDEVDGAVYGVEDPAEAVSSPVGLPLPQGNLCVEWLGLEVVPQTTFDLKIQLRSVVAVAFGSELAVSDGHLEG